MSLAKMAFRAKDMPEMTPGRASNDGYQGKIEAKSHWL